MANLHERLVQCISSIFPALTDQEIRGANLEELVAADSLAAVTLVALIDDEFGVDMDLEGLVQLGSFEGICDYLRDQSVASVALVGKER
jgi:acyl carrier protein